VILNGNPERAGQQLRPLHQKAGTAVSANGNQQFSTITCRKQMDLAFLRTEETSRTSYYAIKEEGAIVPEKGTASQNARSKTVLKRKFYTTLEGMDVTNSST